MPYCGEHSAVKYEQDQRQAASLLCRSWLCPTCADPRKRQLIAEAIGGKPNTFLTLTSRRNEATTAEAAAAALSNAWRVLRKRCLREAARDPNKQPFPFGAAPPGHWQRTGKTKIAPKVSLMGKGLPFIAVVEKTELGWPHLHLLLRSKWLDAHWLSLQMSDLLDSPVLKVVRIDNAGRSAAYCSKYCGKCAQKFATTKRYWKSRDYEQRPDRKDGQRKERPAGWERSKAPLWFLTQSWVNQGFKVTYLSQHKIEATRKPLWEDTG